MIRAVLPGALLVAGFVVLGIAVARPHANVALPRPEGTVMLTFDVSGSMAATDLPPTRMDTARTIASTIVQRQPPGVVVGLVAFSDAGIAVHAPTSDQADILAAIQRLVPARGHVRRAGPAVGARRDREGQGGHAGRRLQQPVRGARGDAAAGRIRRATRRR